MSKYAPGQNNVLFAGVSEVLDAIRLEGATSQSDVVRATGLGRAAVAERIRQLAAAGLLENAGTVAQARGRPPRRLRFRASAGHLLVAALGASSAHVGITDLAGDVLVSDAVPLSIGDGPEAVLGQVDSLFAGLYQRCRGNAGPLWGIGIGIPGPVEFSTGRPVAPPIMPGWDGYAIPERFNARYGAPVWVDNDVNVLALGEWREGVALGHANVAFIKVGTGIGAGIISDGSLHRGAQGAAGDVGHIQVTEDSTVVCRCGNVGCLEAVAGGFAIGRQAEKAAKEGRSPFLAAALQRKGLLTAADVAEAASRGDPTSTEMLQRAGRLIGSMLAGVVNLLNPSLIVIGGGVSGAGDAFLAAIRESVYRRSLPLATRHLLVTRSTLGERGGVVGTAAMVLNELFSSSNLAATLDRSARISGWPGLDEREERIRGPDPQAPSATPKEVDARDEDRSVHGDLQRAVLQRPPSAP
ncbi:MAG: ROK family protein [Candidatus Limnocylindrales bacterium]|jgi:glucokinase-like ROK family protein